jgi:hypothetical protein
LQGEIKVDHGRASPSDEEPLATQSEVNAVLRQTLSPDENLGLDEQMGSTPWEDVKVEVTSQWLIN